MMNKKRLLAGLALGCVLSTPAAFAEEYRGFYFGVWGGSADMDFGSKAAADEEVFDLLVDEFPRIGLPGTSLSGTVTGSELDDSMTAWGAQVGFRFNKWVAAEVGYVDLGELLYTMNGTIGGNYVYVCECEEPTVVNRTLDGNFERSVQVTSAGITAAALGMFPIGPRFDLHVRGGIYYADTRVTNRLRYIDSNETFNLLHGRVDASETELFAGLGAAWNINESFALRVEYQKFFDVGDDQKNGESDIDVLNLALLFK
jgi:OmpA-OmpF porin, OOP family